MIQKIWKVKPQNSDLQKEISKELGISRILAQLLINRNITRKVEADIFLRADLKDLHDPYLLKDMGRAVSRLKKALSKKEKMVVYGDYDADGITAAALLVSVLEDLGADVSVYIPNRLEEGYGLNSEAIKSISKKQVKLIITVDCGISACDQVDLAKSLGIDIIITDHHDIHGPIPAAKAVINPLQPDCDYPFKHLSGVGLAYKLASALTKDTPYPIDEHLDLVALGTIADVVLLVGENRALVKYGLTKITAAKRKGIKALLDVAGLSGKDIISSHVGFMLGPRINAAGRIGSPGLAFKLLVTEDDDQARQIAKSLDAENRNRQKIEEGILSEALIKIDGEINFKQHKVIVLADDSWHEGVIGVVASKLVDRFYRPTILISTNKKLCRGSGRSIEGFHLFEALSKCKDFLSNFGGHEGACGLVIDKISINSFKEYLNKIASDMILSDYLLPKIDIDMEIPLNMLNNNLIAELNTLGPFGLGNPKPVLASYNLEVKNRPVMIGKNGFKFWVTDRQITCEAIEFRKRENIHKLTSANKLSIVYTPTISNWQGIDSIQLNLEDMRPE